MKSITPLPPLQPSTSSFTSLATTKCKENNQLLLSSSSSSSSSSLSNIKNRNNHHSPLPHDHHHSQLERNRTNLTILHFFITYPQWSVALFLFLASRSLPLPSVDDAIHQPLRQLERLLRAETKAYQNCVQRSLDRCNVAIHDAIQQEDDRIRQAREINALRLQQMYQRNAACRNVTQTSRNALQAWSQVNTMSVPLIQNTSVCSVGDKSNLTILLHDGVAAVENDLSDWNHYVSNSESFSHRLVQYTQDVVKYNYDYFVAAKVQPVVRLLHQISSVASPNFHPPAIHWDSVDLNAKVGVALQGVQDVLKNAANEMSIIMERLQEFDTSITGFHLQYTNLYHNFVQVVGFVQDLSLGLPLPSYFDVGSIPLADSLMPFHVGIPHFQGGLLQLDGGVVTNLIQNATRRVVAEVDQVITNLAQGATHQVGLAEQALADKVRDMLTLQDYHPPIFTGLQEELSKLHDESQQAMDNVKNGLDQLWTTTSEDVVDVAPSLSDLDPNNVTFAANASQFDYLEPEFPSLSIPKFIQTIFGWFIRYMWLTELVLQGLRMWRLVAKYSKNATPGLPEIDFGNTATASTNRGVDNDSFVQRKMKSVQLFGFTILRYMCCNFWIILALFTIPLCLGLSCLLYPHYRANCVTSRNGTFIARHIWSPLVVNEANIKGNTMILWGEGQFVHDKSSICNRNVTETTRFHRNNELNPMSQMGRQYNQTLFLVSLLEKCVKLEELDATLEQACCGLRGYGHVNCSNAGMITAMNGSSATISNWTCPIDETSNPPAAFLPIRLYLSHPSCQADDHDHTASSSWELEDSRFDCNALPKTCHVPCRSVYEQGILHQVIQADCAMEGYYFGFIFLFLLALYHAVMLNVWTTMLFNGVKCLWWRHFSPKDCLVMKTHVYEDGTLVQGSLLRQDRMERIRVAVNRFQLLGYLQLGIGVFVMLGWMISFCVLDNIVAV